jgi:hypothetical protein
MTTTRYTTSHGTKGRTRSQHHYIAVDPATATIHYRSDDKARAIDKARAWAADVIDTTTATVVHAGPTPAPTPQAPSQEPADQATLDRITFDTYVDCGRNATAAAKQLGCSPSTVTRRVKRHSLVATAADHGARADKAIASAEAVTGDVEAKLDAHDALVERQQRETAEVGRRTFRCTSTGHNAGGTWVVGPVLVDVVTWQRTDPTGKRQYRPSYSVEIDGRHQYGGPAEHLSPEGIPSGEPHMLTGWTPVPPAKPRKREGAKARIARLAHTDPNEPRPLVCSVCGKSIATDGVSTGGAYYCPDHAPAQRKARERTSGSSVTEGPPPRCPGGGQVGLDGPGSTRCTVCTQDAASVKRDGTLGSHKLLRPRQAVTS